jgi:hypothetical protein
VHYRYRVWRHGIGALQSYRDFVICAEWHSLPTFFDQFELLLV